MISYEDIIKGKGDISIWATNTMNNVESPLTSNTRIQRTPTNSVFATYESGRYPYLTKSTCYAYVGELH